MTKQREGPNGARMISLVWVPMVGRVSVEGIQNVSSISLGPANVNLYVPSYTSGGILLLESMIRPIALLSQEKCQKQQENIVLTCYQSGSSFFWLVAYVKENAWKYMYMFASHEKRTKIVYY